MHCSTRQSRAGVTSAAGIGSLFYSTVQIIPPPIMKSDFEKVLARQKPTVSKGDLLVHEQFTKEFGEEG